jgi:hypothetical protein
MRWPGSVVGQARGYRRLARKRDAGEGAFRDESLERGARGAQELVPKTPRSAEQAEPCELALCWPSMSDAVGKVAEGPERSGGCVCGSVRYVTVGDAERVTICHCTWCQRRTGTAFGTEVVFQEQRVRFSGIEPSCYRHHSDESGRWLEVCFCSRCGSNLGFTLETVPGIRTIPAGTYDDPTWLAPERIRFRHVFARTRRAWSDLSSHVEVYERHFR